MIGQRRARTWRLDILPAPGETSWPAAVADVERERRVAGDVFERNGHIDLDWRKTASMITSCVIGDSGITKIERTDVGFVRGRSADGEEKRGRES
jgi:hypothetical protein